MHIRIHFAVERGQQAVSMKQVRHDIKPKIATNLISASDYLEIDSYKMMDLLRATWDSLRRIHFAVGR